MENREGTRVYERDGKVVLCIAGHYSIKDAERTVPEAGRLFTRLGRCEFVPDLRDMTGFDTDARLIWQEHLAEFKRSVHTVTMIGGSPLARMSGAAVCLYAGIKMKFATSLDEVFPRSVGKTGTAH